MSLFSAEIPSDEKQAVARKSTWISVLVNVVLAALQIAIGVIAHSQALIADGVHSLSDLISDFIVLIANRQGGAGPDADHNYGHSRYETVASLALGAILMTVGIGMLWRAGNRLIELDTLPAVHASALGVALVVVISKEALFRYMLREARRVRSASLVANAWHARSDAASSLVVAIGVLGSLAGVRLFDPIAAAIVGFMVARMGWTFGWDALQDLSDRALDATASAAIRALLADTPGVRDVHALRTRKMGDAALVDAHILVDPMISVSEGHFIAESARARVLADPRVLDALIHVDPENDAEWRRPALALPPREAVMARVEATLREAGVQASAIQLHYLSTGLEIDLTLAANAPADVRTAGWCERFGARRVGIARAVAAPSAQH